MMNKRWVLIVAAIVLVTLSCCGAKDLSPKDLRKSFEKINKHLQENVKTDDVKVNMDKVLELLDEKSSKCMLLGGRSLVKTLNLLSEFAALEATDCDGHIFKRINTMKAVDLGLADESRLVSPNYPLTRLDKIIEYYTFALMRRCGFDEKFLSQLNYSHKELAFDQINQYLEAKLPGVEDVKTNMIEAEAWLITLNPQTGAQAEALKLFLSLRSTLDKATCNEQGYEILLKNDIATWGHAHKSFHHPKRRIDKIFQHYAIGHEELCGPIARKNLPKLVVKLDSDSYKRVLGLVSARYSSERRYNELAKELSVKEIDEEFFLHSVAQEVSKENRIVGRLDPTVKIRAPQLHRYLRAVSVGDPESIYLSTIVDEKSNTKTVNEDKIESLLDKYLFKPCTNYLNMMEGPLEADEYGYNMNRHHLRSDRDKFVEEMAYHMIYAGRQACKYLDNKRAYITETIKTEVKYNFIHQL